MSPQILQPLARVPERSSNGTGSIHYLPATRQTVLWGRLPCARDVSVITIESGDEVTISHEGVLEKPGRDPAAFFGRHGVPREFVLDDAIDLAASDFDRDPVSDGPHVVTGPIHVRGARPDILLTVGFALYLPVQVPGALAYVGDAHFAQGDGEVALTALDASLRVRVWFDVISQSDALTQFGALVDPLAETTDFLAPTGLNADLDEVVRECVRAAINVLAARFGMDRTLAYAYLSAATDFSIPQVVDRITRVHARIRVADSRG